MSQFGHKLHPNGLIEIIDTGITAYDQDRATYAIRLTGDNAYHKRPLSSEAKASIGAAFKLFFENEKANRSCPFCDAGIPQSIHSPPPQGT